jgi:hypothetical protein
VKGSLFAWRTPGSLSPRNRGKLMDLTRDCVARVDNESEEIESIETTEVGVVEIGEMERSFAAQEMICGGAMISKSKQCHTP